MQYITLDPNADPYSERSKELEDRNPGMLFPEGSKIRSQELDSAKLNELLFIAISIIRDYYLGESPVDRARQVLEYVGILQPITNHNAKMTNDV